MHQRRSIRVLCTLGPASLRPEVITGLEQRGVDIFRINLSHTALSAVEDTIRLVRQHASVPICLDTEGAQVRCGIMAPDVALRVGQAVRLTPEKVVGTEELISLRPASAFATLRAGSTLSIDFDGALLRVGLVDDRGATAIVTGAGAVHSNRAVAIDPAPALPPLTAKDRRALEIGAELGVDHVALSFAASGDDVALVRSLLPAGATVIAKIESRAGVARVEEIINAADAVLIDRGDLSREVPLESVPFYQKAIVRQANRFNTPVYVATNLLETMVEHRRATVAEANDIANTLLDGVHGLVLAAETAIGIDPLGVVDAVARSIAAFERSTAALLQADEITPPLPGPAGEPVGSAVR
ncbi:MAG: pyruvate kinase [Acidimicrobiia bacterium]